MFPFFLFDKSEEQKRREEPTRVYQNAPAAPPATSTHQQRYLTTHVQVGMGSTPDPKPRIECLGCGTVCHGEQEFWTHQHNLDNPALHDQLKRQRERMGLR